MCQTKPIRGISVANPVDIEENYINKTLDYTIANGYNHYQFIGPIHNNIRGNLDGMMNYVKYSEFNDEKDIDYINYCKKVVNSACEKAKLHGVKTYMWHHELEIPEGFTQRYPEVLNEYREIEITAERIKDFLENKIKDFFQQYPLIDGIILTLHETRVPLLKLINQKLSKIDRVKYITEILFESCKSNGKELIVRPFASIADDYEMMAKAFESISKELIVFDKWTQYDWSLTLPHNLFFNKIKNNPLLIETDIFGEYFGKGRLPLMLKQHIKKKVSYCKKFNNLVGFCSRVDRGGKHPFGHVNEVNLVIMNAYLKNLDVDNEIDNFFKEKYGIYGEQIKKAMEKTEEVLTKIIYLKGYYFSELSYVPQLNHSKNHFYFEMFRNKYCIKSDEWYIPIDWERGDLESVYAEKDQAVFLSTQMFNDIKNLKGKVTDEDYDMLFKQFANLYYCALIWRELIELFFNYISFFDNCDIKYENCLLETIKKINNIYDEGHNLLLKDFYCANKDVYHDNNYYNHVKTLTDDLWVSFLIEKKTHNKLTKDNLKDFVICGGATEGHELEKEVNFSDTLIENGELCRIPGSLRGKTWSTINTHGWFSYKLNVSPQMLNKIEIIASGENCKISFKVTIGDKIEEVEIKCDDKVKVVFDYFAKNTDKVCLRIDRNSETLPRIYSICVR